MERMSCRVCGRGLVGEPLLACRGMPANAQFLPDAASLDRDEGIDFAVRQCPGCGLVQLDCLPVPYFRDVVRAAAVSGEMSAFRKRQFGEFVDAHGLRSRRVVEIGCGGGEYLSILAGCGVEAYGLEHSGELAARCRSAGLRVTKGFAGDPGCAIEGAPFDAFLMLSTLEHLPEPGAALAGVRDSLAGGAVGLVEVPNFGMILEKELYSELMRDHLLYFTADTLATALRLNGFDVLDCRAVWHDYILSATVAKRPRPDLSGFGEREERLRAELQSYAGAFGRIAVWGAGHQALAVLATAGVAGRIAYVVDSAPFKQGRFTPVSHLPIVPPEALAEDPVEAIVVMAAAYSDEVVGAIRERFPGRMRIAVLRDFGLETVRS